MRGMVKDWKWQPDFLGKIWYMCNIEKRFKMAATVFKFLDLGLSENVFFILFLTSILEKVLVWENCPWIKDQKSLNQ